MFDTEAKVSCISCDCYREFMSKPKTDTNFKANISSADRSNLGPIGVVTCSWILGWTWIWTQAHVMWTSLTSYYVRSDFAQDFRAGIDLNNQG